MASLEDRLEHDVEGWRPEEGESLTGKVVSVDTRPSDYGDDYPLVEVERENGEVVAVHGFHSVLKRELARLRPAPGDTIGIKYFGKAQGRNQTYEKYRVIVERASGQVQSPDWDGMKAQADAEIEPGDAQATDTSEDTF
jgi:hypothetical protein